MLVTALQGGMQAAKVKATDAQKSERILPAAFLLVATQGPAQGFQPQPSAQRLHLGGHGGANLLWYRWLEARQSSRCCTC